MQSRPMTEPGLITALQPISVLSPTIAPNFLRPVGISPSGVITAISGTSVADPFWGWPAGVSVAGTVVTVTNSPVPGLRYRPYGAWDAQIDSIDDGADGGVGRIVVHHLLDSNSADRVGKKDSSGKVQFVVTAVDVAAGTYTLNFNEPVKGRTLIFQVTMVSISRLY